MDTCADIIARSGVAFGTSGVRGLVGDLDDAVCYAFTTAFLDHLKKHQVCDTGDPVWLGHDLRPSSPGIASACIEAVRDAGLEPVFCGVISTPALAFAALSRNHAAIMITGSHIPFDRNGIKFYRPDGEMLKSDEDPVISSTAPFQSEKFSGGSLPNSPHRDDVDGRAAMQWHYRNLSAFDGVLDGLRIGHYQHSAAGRDQVADLLEELGATVVPLARSETFVPIDTEAVSDTDQNQAKAWVSEHGLDALVSTDGDGDRPLLADETGQYFRGDTLGILAAYALGATMVVTPVSSNTALERSNFFHRIERTKIGSPHVIAAMTDGAENSGEKIIGFEANGGFLTATPLSSPWKDAEIAPLPTRDSILPILATIALARKQAIPLSQLGKVLPERVTASTRIQQISTETSRKLIADLTSDPAKIAKLTSSGSIAVDQNQTDGLRLTFEDDDIVHLRPSGNAPELRIYVESASDKTASALLRHAHATIAGWVGEDHDNV